MITGFLSLLCLGLCLGYDDEHKNDTLPKPSLHALPGSVARRGGNVTLKCQGHLQNVTFMLGKWQDPGYRWERSSAGHDAEFLLTHLEPEHAGRYFCAYKTTVSHEWSEKSEHLHLEVTDTLPGPSLHALPGSVARRGGNVTLKCQGHLQNVTFMLGKWQDPGYRWERSSAGHDAEFLLTHLEPEHAGRYFCAYKTTGSHEWSEKSKHLHLEVPDDRDRARASSAKTDSRVIFVTAFSCLAIFLLFPTVFLIYRHSQRGSSHEESTKRTSHPEQEASDLSQQERTSLPTEDPQEGPGADGNSKTTSEAAAASVPAEEPPGSCDCATLNE